MFSLCVTAVGKILIGVDVYKEQKVKDGWPRQCVWVGRSKRKWWIKWRTNIKDAMLQRRMKEDCPTYYGKNKVCDSRDKVGCKPTQNRCWQIPNTFEWLISGLESVFKQRKFSPTKPVPTNSADVHCSTLERILYDVVATNSRSHGVVKKIRKFLICCKWYQL